MENTQHKTYIYKFNLMIGCIFLVGYFYKYLRQLIACFMIACGIWTKRNKLFNKKHIIWEEVFGVKKKFWCKIWHSKQLGDKKSNLHVLFVTKYFTHSI